MSNNTNTNQNSEQDRASREFKNIYLTVPMFDRGRTLTRTYDVKQLVGLLDAVPYSIINIPVFAYRNEYSGNDAYRGNFICGWVEAFNKENKTFDICILEKYADMVEKYDKDTIIYPRVKIIGNNPVGITGLDFCEKRYYSLINR